MQHRRPTPLFWLLSLLVAAVLCVSLARQVAAQNCGGAQLPTIYWGGPAELSFPPYPNASVYIEWNIKLGADLAFTRANTMSSRLGVLACRNLSTYYMDDQGVGSESMSLTSHFITLNQDEFFGFLVGPDATNSLRTSSLPPVCVRLPICAPTNPQRLRTFLPGNRQSNSKFSFRHAINTLGQKEAAYVVLFENETRNRKHET